MSRIHGNTDRTATSATTLGRRPLNDSAHAADAALDELVRSTTEVPLGAHGSDALPPTAALPRRTAPSRAVPEPTVTELVVLEEVPRVSTHIVSLRATAAALLVAVIAMFVPNAARASELARVIVAASSTPQAAAAAVTDLGGQVSERINDFDVVVAELPSAHLDELAADSRTASVTLDQELEVTGAAYGGTVQAATSTVDAPEAWAEGHTGEGVGVVVVDTGIAEHSDLGDRVVARIDVTGEDHKKGLDPHGHGTFMAGLVAGDGTASDGKYAGVAPESHIVSVKVARQNGKTKASDVLEGLVVADRAREQYDAPVVLLALSGPVSDTPDPVMAVLEMLWARGSTVVVPSGNEGEISSPAADPYLIAVGAVDDRGTADPADDVVPDFSGRGTNPAGHVRPDVIAPGKSTVSLRVEDSRTDRRNPDARVEDDYFVGTGTSMAAAVTAGAAATVLSADPTLTPDEVKGRLMGGAAPAPESAEADAVGAGVVDVDDAVASDAGAANGELPELPDGEDFAEDVNSDDLGSGHAKNGNAPFSSFTSWNWSSWNWSSWNWSSWNWSSWNWSSWNWSSWNWSSWNWSSWNWSAQAWAS